MAGEGEYSYIFERSAESGPGVGERLAPGQHSWAEGLREGNVLAHRLSIKSELIVEVLGEKPPCEDAPLSEMRNLFVQMGADFSANIAYYEEQTRQVQKQIKLSQTVAITVLLALLGGLVALVGPFREEAAPAEISSYWVAQVSLVGTAVFAALKAMAVGTNYKARLTAFWSAAADLREALYTFETNWKNKLLTREALLSPDFHVALYEELRAARLVVRREREAYIEALASPNDIFSSASEVLGTLDARITNTITARQGMVQSTEALSVTTAKDVAETRRKLLEAKSQLASAELGLTEAQAANLADLDSYRKAIVDARIAVELYTRQLRLKLKADRLNPT